METVIKYDIGGKKEVRVRRIKRENAGGRRKNEKEEMREEGKRWRNTNKGSRTRYEI